KKEFFSSFSPLIKPIIASLTRKQILKSLHGQGIGRHEAFEIYQIGIKDLTAISDFLADKPYLMGERISSVDASAYGLLANILWTPIESPVTDQARTMTNLLHYCHRIRERFYPA
ncbi:MAG: glutathione S-transferase C-terminal domain-containing protein, partial [Cyanobacteria bacterium J06642_3]